MPGTGDAGDRPAARATDERTESPQTRAALERYRAGRRASYRRFSWAGVALSATSLVATALPWATRLRVAPDPLHPGRYVLVPTHALGLVTLPAGPLVAALSLGCAWASREMSRGRFRDGWAALLAALAALGVGVTEMVQLLLDRRNWIDRLTVSVKVGPLARAVGPGVWVSEGAMAVLILSATTFLWFLWSSRERVAASPGATA